MIVGTGIEDTVAQSRSMIPIDEVGAGEIIGNSWTGHWSMGVWSLGGLWLFESDGGGLCGVDWTDVDGCWTFRVRWWLCVGLSLWWLGGVDGWGLVSDSWSWLGRLFVDLRWFHVVLFTVLSIIASSDSLVVDQIRWAEGSKRSSVMATEEVLGAGFLEVSSVRFSGTIEINLDFSWLLIISSSVIVGIGWLGLLEWCEAISRVNTGKSSAIKHQVSVAWSHTSMSTEANQE